MTSSSWLLLLFDDCYRLIWIFGDFSELFRGFDSIYCRFLFVIDVVWDYRYRFTDWSMTSSLRSWRHTSDFSRCLDAIPLTSSTTLEDFFLQFSTSLCLVLIESNSSMFFRLFLKESWGCWNHFWYFEILEVAQQRHFFKGQRSLVDPCGIIQRFRNVHQEMAYFHFQFSM